MAVFAMDIAGGSSRIHSRALAHTNGISRPASPAQLPTTRTRAAPSQHRFAEERFIANHLREGFVI